MTMQSPQQKAAAETSAWQAQLSQQLAGVALPELQSLLGGQYWVPDSGPSPAQVGLTQITDKVGGQLVMPKGHWEYRPGSLTSLLASTEGGTKKSTLDERAFQDALSTLNRAYGQQTGVSAESIGYQALRSGESVRSPGAVSSSIGSAATALERDRMTALRNLEFSSAQTSMADYNKLLQLMGQGTQTALGLAQGFGGTATGALGGLSNVSPGQSAIGGAASGAAMGSYINVPYGTIIGAVAGGVGGYLAGGG